MTKLRRKTRETEVVVGVRAGDGRCNANTGEPFLDHMLVTLARYAGLDLEVEASGDLPHHLIEDVAITLGAALRAATPERCARYGDATIPMDDAVVQAVLDNGGRPYYEGPLPHRHYEHFMRSLADNAAMTLHVLVQRGSDRHHIVEAAFKAFGLALRQSLATTDAVFSTKGAVELERLEE
jgi:imidazoleglycerol-phosphate dehydratase